MVGKWIDGKPIYRKVVTGLNMNFTATLSNWNTLSTSLNIDFKFLITANVYCGNYKVPTITISNIKPITYHSPSLSWSGCDMLVLEYTKNTD